MTADTASKSKKSPEAPEEEVATPAKHPSVVAVEAELSSLRLIAQSVASKDYRGVNRVIRGLPQARRRVDAVSLEYLTRMILLPSASKVEDAWRKVLEQEAKRAQQEVEMVDVEEKQDDKSPQAQVAPAEALPSSVPSNLTEAELPGGGAYIRLMILIWLMDNERNLDLSSLKLTEVARELVDRLQKLNQRSLDAINAKGLFYYSLLHEREGTLRSIRPLLYRSYRTSVLKQDRISQATLLNLLLRNYLYYSEYDLANKLYSKTQFPDTRTNAEFAKYLYYIGRLKAVQLEYSDAYSRLTQAIRKSPQGEVGRGFRISAYKFAIIVELLMGEIPDRSVFAQSDLQKPLKLYYDISGAVRKGSVNDFESIVEAHCSEFRRDGTLSLIGRLHHNVIKAGLRGINLSYSKVPMEEVMQKLGLNSREEAAGVVSKAIADGVIDATIDDDGDFMQSSWSTDGYSGSSPQRHLHKRIAFCLQLHTETVKAMQYADTSMLGGNNNASNDADELAQLLDLDGSDLDDDDELDF
ncbi:26S proteasome non-ATPase regulatory subunit 3 [Perkinsus olseni]|nr:26S proteasome non-ATPase regulatory subunit 3 [Perkinsus olseni]